MAGQLERDNQGGEKIQGILEENDEEKQGIERRKWAYFEVWPPSFCDLHHVRGSWVGETFRHSLKELEDKGKEGGGKGGDEGGGGGGREDVDGG